MLFFRILNFVSKLFKALWLFLAGILSVTAIYFLLTGVEQGIDVIIQSGEDLDSGVLSAFAVCLWAFLVWYSSRMLSYIKQHEDDEIFSGDSSRSAALYQRYGIPTPLYMHLPRLLAFNCFVCIQVAIFHLPTFYSLRGWSLVFTIIVHNIFYFLLIRWLSPSAPRSLGFLIPLLIAGYTTLIVSWIVWTFPPADHRLWLGFMVLAMFIAEIVAVVLFVGRRRSIDNRRRQPWLRRSRWLDAIGFNPAFNSAEAPYFRLLNGIAVAGLVFYLGAIFVMPFAAVMGPMAFSLLAIGILIGFSNLVTLLSIRTSFNVMILLLTLALLFGKYRDPYGVRLVELETDKSTAQLRPELKTYLSHWFERRLPLIADTTTTTYPVYIVLSDGGASRAGKWTTSVLGYLQDSTYRANPGNSFRDHLLCLAGASGGSVGNCAFYSLLDASYRGDIAPDAMTDHADRFFETDFLIHALARLLGPDIFRHIIPFPVPLNNRADALEESLENASQDTILNAYFRRPLSQVFDTTGLLPILFINTTQVDNGMPGVISSVLPPPHSQRQDVLSLVDSSVRNHGSDIRLSTAAVVSSRFPYVSPAGKVFDRYYVDGGYFDNSGAGTVLELIQELNEFLSDSANIGLRPYANRLSFHLLHITNSEVSRQPSPDIHPLVNDLFSPLITLAGMQGSSTDIGDGILTNAFRTLNTDTANAVIVYSLYNPVVDAGKPEEGYPMSWALSAYQLQRMNKALLRENRSNFRKFNWVRAQKE